MADTDKQNFRYSGDRWRLAIAKTQEMREAGYDIDMTKVLSRAVDQLLDESTKATAERLGLIRSAAPVPVWRRPHARTEVEQ